MQFSQPKLLSLSFFAAVIVRAPAVVSADTPTTAGGAASGTVDVYNTKEEDSIPISIATSETGPEEEEENAGNHIQDASRRRTAAHWGRIVRAASVRRRTALIAFLSMVLVRSSLTTRPGSRRSQLSVRPES